MYPQPAKATFIKSLAKGNIGDTSLSNEILIDSIIKDIKHFKKQIDRIDEQLDLLMEGFEFLTSITVIGDVVGATILGEVGDISRFQTSAQPSAYAGLDPSIYESGDFKANKCRIFQAWLKIPKNRHFQRHTSYLCREDKG